MSVPTAPNPCALAGSTQPNIRVVTNWGAIHLQEGPSCSLPFFTSLCSDEILTLRSTNDGHVHTIKQLRDELAKGDSQLRVLREEKEALQQTNTALRQEVEENEQKTYDRTLTLERANSELNQRMQRQEEVCSLP